MDNANVEQVQQFNYLVNKITEDGRSKADILCSITQAKRTFQNKKTLIDHQ